MRENLKVSNTKLNKVIYLMALVKNQRDSKNFENNILIDDPQVLIHLKHNIKWIWTSETTLLSACLNLIYLN